MRVLGCCLIVDVQSIGLKLQCNIIQYIVIFKILFIFFAVKYSCFVLNKDLRYKVKCLLQKVPIWHVWCSSIINVFNNPLNIFFWVSYSLIVTHFYTPSLPCSGVWRLSPDVTGWVLMRHVAVPHTSNPNPRRDKLKENPLNLTGQN